MSPMKRTIQSAAALTVLVALPFVADAESTFQTTAGGGALNASARVDFRINIPKVLFLQVGTGTLYGNNGASDLIEFNVPAANVGDGNAVAATSGSGDVGSGVVTARVRANGGGNVGLTATTGGALSNGSGGSITFAQISTASSNAALAAPTLVDGGASGTVTVAANGLGIVSQDAQWTYAYENDNVVPGGTYGGVNVNNGRVTYTASLP